MYGGRLKHPISRLVKNNLFRLCISLPWQTYSSSGRSRKVAARIIVDAIVLGKTEGSQAGLNVSRLADVKTSSQS